jgi:hypothetical protein
MHRRLLVLVPLLALAACRDTPRENAAPDPDEAIATTHDAFGPQAVVTERCTSLAVSNGYLTTEGCTSR